MKQDTHTANMNHLKSVIMNDFGMTKPKTWEKRQKYRKSKYVFSEIELYPCYEGHCAKVSLVPLTTGDWRVCIWGADDLGYDFDTSDKHIAVAMYEKINKISNNLITGAGWVRA